MQRVTIWGAPPPSAGEQAEQVGPAVPADTGERPNQAVAGTAGPTCSHSSAAGRRDRARRYSTTIGSRETTMIAAMTQMKFLWTPSMPPKK